MRVEIVSKGTSLTTTNWVTFFREGNSELVQCVTSRQSIYYFNNFRYNNKNLKLGYYKISTPTTRINLLAWLKSLSQTELVNLAELCLKNKYVFQGEDGKNRWLSFEGKNLHSITQLYSAIQGKSGSLSVDIQEQ